MKPNQFRMGIYQCIVHTTTLYIQQFYFCCFLFYSEQKFPNEQQCGILSFCSFTFLISSMNFVSVFSATLPNMFSWLGKNTTKYFTLPDIWKRDAVFLSTGSLWMSEVKSHGDWIDHECLQGSLSHRTYSYTVSDSKTQHGTCVI